MRLAVAFAVIAAVASFHLAGRRIWLPQDRLGRSGVAAFPPPKIVSFAPSTRIVTSVAAVDDTVRVAFGDTPHQGRITGSTEPHVVAITKAPSRSRSLAVGDDTDSWHALRLPQRPDGCPMQSNGAQKASLTTRPALRITTTRSPLEPHPTLRVRSVLECPLGM